MTLEKACRIWLWRDVSIWASGFGVFVGIIRHQTVLWVVLVLVYALLLFSYQVIFPKVMLFLMEHRRYKERVAKIPGWVYPIDSYLSLEWHYKAVEQQVAAEINAKKAHSTKPRNT